MSTNTIGSKAKHVAPKIDEYIMVFPPQSAPFLCETGNPLYTHLLLSCLNYYYCRCRPLITIISANNNESYDNSAIIIVIIID